MINKKIGVLTIGGSPRPDLVDPLRTYLPDGYQVVEAGALDGLLAKTLPRADGLYPLTTRLQDGSPVMVEEAYLLPKLQEALDRLEAQEVVATILLCAGTFASLQGQRPLHKPFSIALNLLKTMDLHKIGLIAPIQAQETPIRQRWQAAGFRPTVWTADLSQQDEPFRQQLFTQIGTHQLNCIVLDYVGHPVELVRQLQNTANIPVFDLGQLAMETIANSL